MAILMYSWLTDSSTSNTSACDPPVTRRRDRSDDERRLLGDYEFAFSFRQLMQSAESESKRKDPDAVPITRPCNSTWQDRMTPGVRHTLFMDMRISLHCDRSSKAARDQ